MNHIKKKIERDYLFGCIKYKNQWDIYLMPVIYWILNNEKYNPDYNPKEWEFIFRGNILNVPDEAVPDFLRAIAVDKIDLNIDLEGIQSVSNVLEYFHFFIDFDKKLYVTSFTDIGGEEYLPSDDWTGISNNPINFLPKNLKEIFETSV